MYRSFYIESGSNILQKTWIGIFVFSIGERCVMSNERKLNISFCILFSINGIPTPSTFRFPALHTKKGNMQIITSTSPGADMHFSRGIKENDNQIAKTRQASKPSRGRRQGPSHEITKNTRITVQTISQYFPSGLMGQPGSGSHC